MGKGPSKTIHNYKKEKIMNNNTKTAKHLVNTDWLEQNLASPNLRVFDCAVIAGPNPDPELGKTHPFAFASGQEKFAEGHIQGAGFIDILGDLSDKSASFPLMLPPEQQFANVMSAHGIGDEAHVVLYSSTEPMWAARVWWMLRAFGFNNASILDGGFAKWEREKRAVSQEVCNYPASNFSVKARLDIIADRQDVLKATKDENICIINALPPAMHTGIGGPVFGRKGRIASSVNVPTGILHDPDTGKYLATDKLRQIFEEAGADKAANIITYCGGGIASSNDAFALTLLGYENVSVYDASMFEWGNDSSLPMQRD